MTVLNLEQKFHFNVLTQRACEAAGIPHMRVDYAVRGGVGGNCDVAQNTINLNEALAAKNFSDYNNIVVHEVAHMVDYVRNDYSFRQNGRGRIFHDKVFYSIMQAIINILRSEFENLGTPSRCHQFDVSKVSRKQRRWEYRCGCNVHSIATVTHNRMQAGKKKYHCKSCKGNLTYTGKEIT